MSFCINHLLVLFPSAAGMQFHTLMLVINMSICLLRFFMSLRCYFYPFSAPLSACSNCLLNLFFFRKSFALGAHLTRDLPGEPMSVQEIHRMRWSFFSSHNALGYFLVYFYVFFTKLCFSVIFSARILQNFVCELRAEFSFCAM